MGMAVLALLFLLFLGSCEAAKTVFLFRHCVRAPGKHISHGKEGDAFKDPSSWADQPDFNMTPDFCLPGGIDILTGTGNLLGQDATLEEPVTLIADAYKSIQRTPATAFALATGLGLQKKDLELELDPVLWEPVKAGVCKSKVNKAAHEQWVNDQLANAERPPNYDQLVEQLSNLVRMKMNISEAQLPCHFGAESKLWGGCYVAQWFSEQLLFLFATGIPNPWDATLTEQLVTDLLPLHMWYRSINSEYVPSVGERYAGLFTKVVDDLASDDKGTHIYVGHDSDQNAWSAILNIVWETAPYKWRPLTLPGGAIRLDKLDNGDIRIRYLAPLFDGQSGSFTMANPYNVGDANPDPNEEYTIPLGDLRNKITAAIDPECIPPKGFVAGCKCEEKKQPNWTLNFVNSQCGCN